MNDKQCNSNYPGVENLILFEHILETKVSSPNVFPPKENIFRTLSLKKLVRALDLPISFEAFLKFNHASIETYGFCTATPSKILWQAGQFLGGDEAQKIGTNKATPLATSHQVASSLKRAIAKMEDVTLEKEKSQKRIKQEGQYLASNTDDKDVAMDVYNERLYSLCKDGIQSKTLDQRFSVIRENVMLIWYRRLMTRSFTRYLSHTYGSTWRCYFCEARRPCN